ncbi:MAG: YkgJ family cysteine cluster protein [Euryarchaeota archaeon]|nr:YkgJ family cysteine cluster protein [Euryarchaeota archaeon]
MVLIYSEPGVAWKCVFKECRAFCCAGGREATAGDIRRISEATGLAAKDFAELQDDKGLFRLKSVNGKCIFLNEDYSCQLHKKGVKPIFCRMYPFKFDGIIYADEVVLKVKVFKECPGFGKGFKIGDKFEANIEELGNKFVKEIKDFLRLKKEGLTTEEILKV